jgi:exoribonuclease R
MEEQILRLLGQKDYAPANVPEMLRLLRWPPNRQQELQRMLRTLEQTGRITRTKGNRYILSREADLIPGRIQINRQGKGFLQPDDVGLKEIMIPEEATSTALQIRAAHRAHARDDLMTGCGQRGEHARGLPVVDRFSQELPTAALLDGDHGVRPKDEQLGARVTR